jgi:hypothetical protein
VTRDSLPCARATSASSSSSSESNAPVKVNHMYLTNYRIIKQNFMLLLTTDINAINVLFM